MDMDSGEGMPVPASSFSNRKLTQVVDELGHCDDPIAIENGMVPGECVLFFPGKHLGPDVREAVLSFSHTQAAAILAEIFRQRLERDLAKRLLLLKSYPDHFMKLGSIMAVNPLGHGTPEMQVWEVVNAPTKPDNHRGRRPRSSRSKKKRTR